MKLVSGSTNLGLSRSQSDNHIRAALEEALAAETKTIIIIDGDKHSVTFDSVGSCKHCLGQLLAETLQTAEDTNQLAKSHKDHAES